MGCIVLAGVVLLLWLVKIVVGAIAAVLSTPYPWIAMGLAGAGFAVFHGRRIFRTERREKLFFDTVAALRDADPDALGLLAALEQRCSDEADALLVVAVTTASQGRYMDAYALLDSVGQRATTIGALSGGLELQFPGLAGPLRFDRASPAPTTIERLKGHMLTLAGRPEEALAHLAVKLADPDYAVCLGALADAREATGDRNGTITALRAAITSSVKDPTRCRFFRYKLANVLEAGGAPTAAMDEYERLLVDGEYKDATDRHVALVRARAGEEQRAAERARAEAEEGETKRREQEQQKLTRLLALVEKNLAAGDAISAADLLAGALTLPGAASIEMSLRYKLAAAFEEAAMLEQAAEQYERLIRHGAPGDATSRLESLRAAQEKEQRRRLVVRDEDIVRHTLERMEAAKGPAGRRSTMQAGLSALATPHARERLMVEASKMEVQAVLDKVDGLKTASAKRRNVLAALEAIRTDDVPDELQTQQIQWLEQALTELEGK